MREKNVYTVQTKNQMCNQLFWAAGNMAAALEYGFNVTMLTFDHADKFVLADEEKDEEIPERQQRFIIFPKILFKTIA